MAPSWPSGRALPKYCWRRASTVWVALWALFDYHRPWPQATQQAPPEARQELHEDVYINIFICKCAICRNKNVGFAIGINILCLACCIVCPCVFVRILESWNRVKKILRADGIGTTLRLDAPGRKCWIKGRISGLYMLEPQYGCFQK